jgi:hypothetical protein
VHLASKHGAFWCKTQCVLVLNALQNGAKRKTKWHKNALQWYKYNPFEPLKVWLKRAKHPLKSGILGAKRG